MDSGNPFQMFPVFRVRYPLEYVYQYIEGGRYRTAIFVQTRDIDDLSGTNTVVGFQHHLVGDIISPAGMKYTKTPMGHHPVYHDKPLGSYIGDFLGYTNKDTYPDKWDELLGGIPAPWWQLAPRPDKPWCDFIRSIEPLRFFERGMAEPKVLFTPTVWVEERVIPALKAKGLIIEPDNDYPNGMNCNKVARRDTRLPAGGPADSGRDGMEQWQRGRIPYHPSFPTRLHPIWMTSPVWLGR